MRNCCAANQFSGCCEGGDCTSYAARAEEINRKIKTVQAKRNAGFALLAYPAASCIAVALISLSFAYAAMPESNRLARANQEQVAIR
jgi:hypothetical protein